MTGVDHRLPPTQAQRSKAFDKNSRSTTSWSVIIVARHDGHRDGRVELNPGRVSLTLSL
jgi:hypothetical protein